jgi:hypothetical protein
MMPLEKVDRLWGFCVVGGEGGCGDNECGKYKTSSAPIGSLIHPDLGNLQRKASAGLYSIEKSFY